MRSKQFAFGFFLTASCQYLRIILQLKSVGCYDNLFLVGVNKVLKGIFDIEK